MEWVNEWSRRWHLEDVEHGRGEPIVEVHIRVEVAWKDEGQGGGWPGVAAGGRARQGAARGGAGQGGVPRPLGRMLTTLVLIDLSTVNRLRLS